MDYLTLWKYFVGVTFYSLLIVDSIIIAIPATWWTMEVLPWKNQSPHSEKDSLEIKRICLRLSGYSKDQALICTKYYDHMPAVSIGARIGIEECQRQLKYRQWNCSIPHNSDVYGGFTYYLYECPISWYDFFKVWPAQLAIIHCRTSGTKFMTSSAGLPSANATKEAAFAHAISNAGVVHAIARSCKEGKLSTCGCSDENRPEDLHRDWLWGGCGDNLKYAYWFAKNFIDIREKESSFPRGSKDLANIIVNLHNNNAGRMAVYKMSSVACKCHGVSGSCSLRSCWKQLPPFIQIGHHMTQKYDMAKQVRFNRKGTHLRKISGHRKKLQPDELIYFKISPDYCELSRVHSGFITSGRECKLDRKKSERCEGLCCNRRYRTFTREVHEKCHCKFIWCCKIKCQVCIRLEQVHVCN